MEIWWNQLREFQVSADRSDYATQSGNRQVSPIRDGITRTEGVNLNCSPD